MRDWLSEVVVTGVNFLCAMTNHAGACLVWRMLWRPYCWAADVFEASREYADRHDCPVCAKPLTEPPSIATVEWELTSTPDTYTVGSAQAIVLYARPKGSA